MTIHHTRPLFGALAALALVGTACSSGPAKKAAVTASDYHFNGLPATLKAGAVLSLTNTSTKEIHEMVAIRLPDTERRPVSELVQLPEDQLGDLSPGLPATVLIAPPGGAPQIPAVGDGTLKERGRYMVLCFIPTGADPGAYLAAAKAAQSTGGPPQQVPGGPPHFTHGMYAQVVVK